MSKLLIVSSVNPKLRKVEDKTKKLFFCRDGVTSRLFVIPFLHRCNSLKSSDAVKRRSGDQFYRLIKNKEYISNIPYFYFYNISKKPIAASPHRRNFSPRRSQGLAKIYATIILNNIYIFSR